MSTDAPHFPLSYEDIATLAPMMEALPAHIFAPFLWCPLFGGFPALEEPPSAPAMRAIAAIAQARELWGLRLEGWDNQYGVNIWGGFVVRDTDGRDWVTHCPSDEHTENAGYSAEWARIAREIFGAEDLLHLAHMFSGKRFGIATYRGAVVVANTHDADEVIDAAIALARKLPSLEQGSAIPDYAIVAILAIREACIAFKQALLAGEVTVTKAINVDGRDVSLWNPLDAAAILLARAQQERAALEIRALEPDAKRGKKVHSASSAGGKARSDAFEPKRRQWQELANELWRSNSRLKRAAVARKIAEKTGDPFDSIRKSIVGPPS